jgi:hypothetical protein
LDPRASRRQQRSRSKPRAPVEVMEAVTELQESELFRLDSWDPFVYPSEVVDVVDQEWSVS